MVLYFVGIPWKWVPLRFGGLGLDGMLCPIGAGILGVGVVFHFVAGIPRCPPAPAPSLCSLTPPSHR